MNARSLEITRERLVALGKKPFEERVRIESAAVARQTPGVESHVA
jgi:hypothetical protein